MKKFVLAVVSAFISIFLFASCSSTIITVEKTYFFFDTVITAKLYDAEQTRIDTVFEQCFNELERIENVFSVTNAESELSKLNASASEAPVKVSDELFYVVSTALYYCELSDGALDISVGKLVDLWGIGTEAQRIPAEGEIKELLGVSYKSIVADETNKTIFYSDDRVKIDLGAVAKGYAGDRILQILAQNNIYGAVFSLGGNIVTYGHKPDGSGFTIGIADPKENEQLSATIVTNDCAVVTSGDYQRYFIENGITYHHILDSKTGFPSDTDISGVTVICRSSIQADCLSTAVFVLGREKGLELIENIQNVEAVAIEKGGSIFASSGIEAYTFESMGGD